ncbi:MULTISPECIES: DUF1638 domain-containing protein [Caldilinea]|uniref:DUF1638 domain-containing protein n=1 Tax=Caldilinea aerophila (strain DSM 14535 / JCM 11387 / NBRC 104270 / STL-6-O1) TaxID=926550 RepID=I0I432_CALAS|nr:MULTISPECIES: DUF1638 domain-containing protein [Caldilinea]MBO9392305.1 DUF1638 domain-containing protein [Caldilinea sp.]BAM00020.1 hypothetical protein CLDAP_19800 [Caldilinea aerophila DSM 14535 = NBRC 104270]GIV73313.1 MAG: hypothetical protein KatS3mg049_1869 [Caldilinea sp.]
MSTCLIICGALAREILALKERHGWQVDVVAVPATFHIIPARIAPAVEKRIVELRQRYDRLIVVYGDCGTGGALDEMLDRLGVERIAGPHCYEWYGGSLFQQLMDEEPGTYFLTDFMVRHFRTLILKSMGLDRFPQLKQDYFGNYRRVVYLVQKPDPTLIEQAKAVASYLGLPLEIRATGYNFLEARLLDLLQQNGTSSYS